MSTNATIRIERENGTKTGIYLHWDGYIAGAGTTLQLAYNTAEKVEKLLALGDLSSLGYYVEPKDGSGHDFEHPQKDVCVAYHRDRGEEFQQSDADINEYVYTFVERDACWFVDVEEPVRDTFAQVKLSLGTQWVKRRDLLLNAIQETDYEGWRDDEFAKKGEVVEACAKKAREAREEIIKREALYGAYCC